MLTTGTSFLVIDFEFTTFGDRGCTGQPRGFFPEIIEVGAVLLTPPDYKNGTEYEDFVKPRFFPKLSDFCREIALIEQEDVDGGIDAGEMLQELRQLFDTKNCLLTAWGDSDYKVLAEVCRKYKLENPFPAASYLDLASAYRDFHGHGYRTALSIALAEYQVEQSGFAHTALADALNTAELLRRMLAAGWKV